MGASSLLSWRGQEGLSYNSIQAGAAVPHPFEHGSSSQGISLQGTLRRAHKELGDGDWLQAFPEPQAAGSDPWVCHPRVH